MKKFAVFDLDGTLIRWQLYHTVVDRLAKNGALGESAHQRLRDARMRWKRREAPDAFKAYETLLIEMFESAIQTIDMQVFDDIILEVIDIYKDQVYTYTRDLIKELKVKNYCLLAISGSHEELVEQIALHYGFDDFVGSRYERDDDGFNGKSYIASFDKKTALDVLIKKHNLSSKDSYAIGDSQSDACMLDMVDHPIAFNPDKNLYDIAVERKWAIVIERKNVIYCLNAINGNYRLEQ